MTLNWPLCRKQKLSSVQAAGTELRSETQQPTATLRGGIQPTEVAVLISVSTPGIGNDKQVS